VFTLLRIEFTKLARSRGFQFSFVALAGFITLMLWGFYTYVERKTGSPSRSTRLSSPSACSSPSSSP
jgi:hypothetical protein